jgi:hypothetical protein
MCNDKCDSSIGTLTYPLASTNDFFTMFNWMQDLVGFLVDRPIFSLS